MSWLLVILCKTQITAISFLNVVFKQFIAYSDKVSLSAMISDQLRSLWNYQQLIWGEKHRYNDSILKEVKVQLFKSVGHHFFLIVDSTGQLFYW